MRDMLLVLIMLGLIPLILYRTWFGALGWTWIGIVSPQKFLWQFDYVPFALLIALAFLLSWILCRDKRPVPWNAAMVAMVTFAIYVTLKMPLAWNQDPAWAYWSQFMKVLLMAVLTSTVIYTEQRVKALVWVMMGSLAFFGVKGGIFTILTRGEYMVEGPSGTFLDSNTFVAVALIMALPLYLAVARNLDNAWLRRMCWAGFALTTVSIIFTYSRGALLGLGAMAPFMFLQTRRKLLVVLALIPIAIAGVAFTPQKLFTRAETIKTYDTDWSALERLRAWGVAKNVALQNPLGGGFVLDATPLPIWEKYAEIHDPYFHRAAAAHSSYFQVLGEQGFPGLAIWLTIMFGTHAGLWRARRLTAKLPGHRWIADYSSALQIGLLGFSISGAFVSLGYSDLFYLFAVIGAVLLREARAAVTATASESIAQPAVATS